MPMAIRGPFSGLFRAFGVKRSKMHPNLCTSCESNFARLMKQKQIPVSTTILFADIRGYTDLSQQVEADKLNELLNRFYLLACLAKSSFPVLIIKQGFV